MLDPPEILRLDPQPTAVIRLTVARSEVQRVMGPAIEELLTVARAQGVGPEGPVYSYHPRMDPETFDFQVGVPVSGPIAESGRVRPGELPGGRIARAIYRGPYDGLGAAWGEFGRWLAAQGLAPAPNLWERYLEGPETGVEPESWRTELNRPLVDG